MSSASQTAKAVGKATGRTLPIGTIGATPAKQRAAWAQLCNRALGQYGHGPRIDRRSYERQGIDQIPTVHLGVAAPAMEERGVRTQRGDLNRETEVTNQKPRQLKARISKLQKRLKEEQENTGTLADHIQGILSRRAQDMER